MRECLAFDWRGEGKRLACVFWGFGGGRGCFVMLCYFPVTVFIQRGGWKLHSYGLSYATDVEKTAVRC